MIIEVAHAGVISEAPTFAQVGLRVLYFLLQIFGVIAIIVLVVAGIMYFTATGDQNRMQTAKRAVIYAIVGILVGLGALIIVRQIGLLLK